MRLNQNQMKKRKLPKPRPRKPQPDGTDNWHHIGGVAERMLARITAKTTDGGGMT